MLNDGKEVKYYESHVTVEPLFGTDFDVFTEVCLSFGFKPAKLFMQKDREATPQRSDKDTFCTGHSKSFKDLEDRMLGLVEQLQHTYAVSVWRFKIEAILVDERLKPRDTLALQNKLNKV